MRPHHNTTGVSGRVLHAETERPLSGVAVRLRRAAIGGITNEGGRFTLLVDPHATGTIPEMDTLVVRSEGFARVVREIALVRDSIQEVTVRLDPEG